MLVKNWYRLFSCCNLSNIYDGKCVIKDVTGNEFTLYGMYGDVYTGSSAIQILGRNHMDRLGSNTARGIVFGTGTTEPSLDDYSIANLIDPSIISMTYALNTNYNDGIRIYTYNITNNSENPITISEYGYIDLFNCYIAGPIAKYILFTHALLDIPVTIQAGETGTVVVKETIPTLSQ